jgi:RNA polymerase sigma factor (sigma-70 family)
MAGMSADVSGMGSRSPTTDSAVLASAVRDLASIYTVARLAIRREAGETVVEFEDPSAAEQPEKRAAVNELLEFVDRLPETQREFIRLYYFEELTLEQVGMQMGFSKSWGCKLHRAALASLREMMGQKADK